MLKTFKHAMIVVLLLVASQQLIWTPVGAAAIADAFDFPVGPPDGTGYDLYGGYGFLAVTWDGTYHPGEDLNRSCGYPDCDRYDPVYAVANGRVIEAGYFTPNWGNIVLIEHTLPDSSKVWSQYAHLENILVWSGDVSRGQQIGTIGKGANNVWAAHLHFEMRTQLLSAAFWPTGMTREWVQAHYTNPRQFIRDHRQIGPTCSAPSLNSPHDGYVHTSSDRTITFSWSPPSNCAPDGYTFRVSTSSSMDIVPGLPDRGEGETQTSHTFGSEWDNRDLWWSVRACKPCTPYNPGPWAPPRRFRIEPGAPPSCNPNADQVALYADTGYAGNCVTLGIGDYRNPGYLGSLGNDNAESIRVGSNVQATLCEDDDYQGRCETFTGDDSNLGDNYIGANVVSSVKVESRPAAGEWQVEYFRNTNLSDLCANRNESGTFVFRDWQEDVPASGCPSDYWSARFRRSVHFQSGSYTFGLGSDDWSRIYVGSDLVVDNWEGRGQHYESRYLNEGDYDVKVEFADTTGLAWVSAWWWGPGFDMPRESKDPNQWYAEYWGNKRLSWDSIIRVNEGTGDIYHEWGTGGPGWSLPDDRFSTRFERTVDLACGTYRFHIFTDDGVRFWVDGEQRLDKWFDGVNGYDVDLELTEGDHILELKHYENGGSAALHFSWDFLQGCADTTQPTGRITSPSSGSATNSCPITIQAEASDDQSGVQFVEFHVMYDLYWHQIGNDSTWPYSIPWDCSSVSDQQVWLTIHIVDNAGNEAMDPGGYVYVTLDRENPSGKITSPPDGGYVNSDSVVIIAEATDTGSGVDRVEFGVWYQEDGTTHSWTATDSDGSDGWTVTWDTSAVQDTDKIDVWAWIIDRAGNRYFTAVAGITLDRIPPTVRILSPANNSYVNTDAITVTGEATDSGSGMKLVAGELVTGGQEIGWCPEDTDGTDGWNFTCDLSAISDRSDLRIVMHAYDKADNWGWDAVDVVLDRTAPSSSVDPLPTLQPTSSVTVTWSGSDAISGLASFDVQYKDGYDGLWTDLVTTTTLTSTLFTGENWHTHCFQSRALDRAGNIEDYPGGDGDTCTTISLPDSYEPDDSPAHANPIAADGTLQMAHNFHIETDIDWVKFDAIAGTTYVLETSNLGSQSDTVLSLYDIDGTTLLEWDDDGGVGLASRIVYKFPSSGLYFIEVAPYGSWRSGPWSTYDLSVTVCEPDIYEPDNTFIQASWISTDAPSQIHNFHRTDDVDWVKLDATIGVSYTLTITDTGAYADAVLELYDSDGTTLLATDYSFEPQLVYSYASRGIYFVKMLPWSTRNTGPGSDYEVAITEEYWDDMDGPEIGDPSFSNSVASNEPVTVTVPISDSATGNHGVSEATLYHGYTSPYTDTAVAGTGPGGNGDGIWTFVIPAQGDARESQTLRFWIEAEDRDVSPASTIKDNSGNYYQIDITDDDTIPPSFSNASPSAATDIDSITFKIDIYDDSGIYDTASNNSSIYLQWDTDGEFLVDVAGSLDMDHASGATYQADVQIGPFPEATELVWRVWAEDNDNTRSGSWSDIYQLDIGDVDIEGPSIGAPSFPDAIVSNQTLSVTVSISDAATGGNGVSGANLFYGFTTPYTQIMVTGDGPGGNGDGIWTFAIPAQGDANEDQTFKFSIVARDNDDSPASSINDNLGNYFSALVSDDDTSPPTFSNPAPSSGTDSDTITLQIDIADQSGTYDTPSNTSSVYLQWDTDGEFSLDIGGSVDMDYVSGNMYRADTPIGPFSAGTTVSWRVWAEDNDNTKSGAWSDIYSLTVSDDDTEGPSIGMPIFASSVPSDEDLTVTLPISDTLTGNHGVDAATLYYGYTSPFTDSQVIGAGPGGNGDGTWTFVIPAQGDSNEYQSLKFSIVAQDSDTPPAASTNNNSGNYFSVLIPDDDTTAPTFSNSTPSSATDSDAITFQIDITDNSGIYDTPGNTSSVYLQWDTDEEFSVDVGGSIDMDKVSADIYEADSAVGPFSAGTTVSWRVFAQDNDNSKTGAWSDIYEVSISDDDTHGPVIYTPIFDSDVASDQPLTVTVSISDASAGNHGVYTATVYYGYASPHTDTQIVGSRPGGNGDGIWRFDIPAQGDTREGQTLKFFITAKDGDNTRESSINDNSGNYYGVHVTDDDTTGPVIGTPSFHPTVHAAQTLTVTVPISDFSAGDNGVDWAMLYYGYSYPYDEYNTPGVGPEDGADGLWTFHIPPQGESHKGSVLKFYVVGWDGDNSPSTTTNDNEGVFYSVLIPSHWSFFPMVHKNY